MDSSDLNDISSVRLASGIEMQQKWLPLAQIHQQQKNDTPPHLIEMAPTRGTQGTVVTVVVQSLPHRFEPVKLAFNSLVVDTKQMYSQGITSLVATVPPFEQTLSATTMVPISVCMLDKDSVTETWPVAEFIYDFETKNSLKASIVTPTIVINEPSTMMYSEKAIEDRSSTYHSREGGAVPYKSYYHQSVNNYNDSSNQQMAQFPYPIDNVDIRCAYDDNKYDAYRLNNSSTVSQQHDTHYNNDNNNINVFSPNSSDYPGVLTGYNQTNSTSSAPISEQSLIYSSHKSQHQKDKQPAPSPEYKYDRSATHIPSTSVANYQPYPGLISRANLKIMGDLESMAKSWSTEEWENRRRLVQFWRKQSGNEICCTFDPIFQSERINTNSNHIVVSCIYWAERNDCYITSVDCIHLLESLMDTRFSVEEKNRVRRNLEGFRPITLIMSFPNPKPRNIEKDVKVFPWKTLPYALKKIITKYTASSYGTSGNQPHRCATIDHISSTINNTATFMLPSAAENIQQENERPYQIAPLVRKYSSPYAQPEPNQVASSAAVNHNGISKNLSESITTTSTVVALDPNPLSNINSFKNEHPS
ncbi:uncharacterized protein EV154DRAFT_485869 [Mucor mucedo]|uniref:uncharacterized protein n=1 Tax=Mucor mucedo TaxID=29922 RepID=UPI00221F462A|nr:uncharacterized protein EV154DRAFT_485869 [Mucor mucedo]KAI7880806.1 hypothetical protein EV154DRAFT_485869 [Mucor mucedo]